MAGKPESPIEWMLYNAMLQCDLKPVCQYHIGRYRVDFAFPKHRLVVEADGKAFHKGWRKRRDNRRDAWLRNRGWEVMRFTGSEIYKASFVCAAQVRRRLRK